MLLGDSLTEFGWGYHWKYKSPDKGWVALLSEAYSRKADILNRGMAGYNSRWGLQVLPSALADAGCSRREKSWRQRLPQHQAGTCNVQLLTIWFGANDIVDKDGDDGRLHVPLEEYKRNVASMVQLARQAGVQQVLLITPPPVDEAMWAKERNKDSSDRTNAALERYAAAVREVAKAAGAPLLDVHAAFAATGPSGVSSLLNDGVHLNAKGNQAVFASLAALLESGGADFAGLRAGELPTHYPLFNQVDASNPGRTFRELWEKKLVQPDSSQRVAKAE